MGLTDIIEKVADVFMDSPAPRAIGNAAQSSARHIGNTLPDLPMGPAGDFIGAAMRPIGQAGGDLFGGAMSGIGTGRDMFGGAMSGFGGRDPFGGSMSLGGGRDPFGNVFQAQGNPWSNRDMFSDKMTIDKMRQEQANWAKLQEGEDGSNPLTVGQNSGLSGDPSKAQTDRLRGTDKWNDMILKAAQETGVPASVIKGLMAIESGGNASVGTNTSGATGLMQVVGSIWQGTANQFGGDLNDPWTNIRTGAEILKMNKSQYGTWEGAIAAYLGSPVQDATGAWRGGTVPDANGTTGQMYVEIAKNNIAWIEQQYAQSVPSGEGGNLGFGNSHAPNAIAAARTVVGMPYVWGAYQKETGGFDCSGLIVWAYNQAGKNMPRETSQTMHAKYQPITEDQLQAGDLITYSFPGGQEGADHVAMYIGNGQVIQATSSTGNVTITSSDWAKGNIVGYRRVP